MNSDKFAKTQRPVKECEPSSPTRNEILRVLNHILEQRQIDGQGDQTKVTHLIEQARRGFYDKTLESEWKKRVEVANSRGMSVFVFEFGDKFYSTEKWDHLAPSHAPELHWTEPKEIEKL